MDKTLGRVLMAAAVFGAANTEPAYADGPISRTRDAHANIQRSMREACSDAADAARNYSGAQLSDELVEIDSELREEIQDETYLWRNVRDGYEAQVEPLIRRCAVRDSRRYDDLGGPAETRRD